MFLGTWLLRYWHWSELSHGQAVQKILSVWLFLCAPFHMSSHLNFYPLIIEKLVLSQSKCSVSLVAVVLITEDGLKMVWLWHFSFVFFFLHFYEPRLHLRPQKFQKNVSGHCLHSSYLSPALLDDACQQLLAWCTNACMCPCDGPKISLVGACIVLWSVHVK